MDDVIVRLNEKLESAVKRLRDGNHDDHDILPGLLWVLLEYNRSHRDNLEQLRDKAERTSAEISSLAKTLQSELEKLQHNTSKDLIKTGDDLKARIGSLTQTLQEECEKFRYQLGNVADSTGTLLKSSNEDLKQTLGQSAVQLQNLVETKVHRLSEAHQSGLRWTDNKLWWILMVTVFQIIFIIVMSLVFSE
ncbi:hypothetical protein EPO44_21505 [bacterium]|nr:MAG: hypothetical protein EPO44_21505 [bacterium]